MKSFCLLCWNIQKKSADPRFARAFEELWLRYRFEIAALQEAALPEGGHLPLPFEGFEAAASCNLRLPRRRYGVLTLSKAPMRACHPYLSGVREAGFATRKSALLTHHDIGGEAVALLNLHALNFVPYRLFAQELERLASFLAPLQSDRLVVAGDFNTWSRKRQGVLEEMMGVFDLERVAPSGAGHLKAVLGKPLDHVYVRGLAVVRAEAVPTAVSDHNPIVATFAL
ncbi:endonuclease/exonuclease/phosphatase family protein [Hydrogenimonas sp.]